MSLENPIRKTENDVTNSVLNFLRETRALFLPVALAGFLNTHEANAQSIESIKGQDWSTGVTTLQESVINGNTEVGAVYVKNKDGHGQWRSFGTGSETRLKATEEELEKIIGDEAVIFCRTHTHPLVSFVA
jgi:hypothetical protein